MAHQFQEVCGAQWLKALVTALGIDSRTHKVDHAHPGYFHRVLEGQKQPLVTAILGRQRQQVGIAQGGSAGSHHKTRIAGQYAAECAVARAVGPHDGVHLTRTDGQVDTLENFLTLGRRGS